MIIINIIQCIPFKSNLHAQKMKDWDLKVTEDRGVSAGSGCYWLHCKQANGSWTSSSFSITENGLTMKAATAAADWSHVKHGCFSFSNFYSDHLFTFVTVLLTVDSLVQIVCLILPASTSAKFSSNPVRPESNSERLQSHFLC